MTHMYHGVKMYRLCTVFCFCSLRSNVATPLPDVELGGRG